MARPLTATTLALILVLSIATGACAKPGIILPLYGNFNIYFHYYMNITVGTPPMLFASTLDTGSTDFLIPDVSCTKCVGPATNKYHAIPSSTEEVIYCGNPDYKCASCATNNQCIIAPGFVGMSMKAALSLDTVGFPEISDQADTTVSAILEVKYGDRSTRNALISAHSRKRAGKLGGFYPQGLLGMAYPGLSASGSESVFDSFRHALKLDDVFSHCSSKSGMGGAVMFGGILPYYSGKIQYTPMSSLERFYSMHMVDLKMGGITLGFPPVIYNTKNCIVDTGTPVPTLPMKVFDTIRMIFMMSCNSSKPYPGVCGEDNFLRDSTCVSLTSSEINSLPTLDFVFDNDLHLTYPPSAYLRPMYFCEKPGTVGLALSGDPSGFGTVIGMNLLNQYVTVYDKEKRRMGFALENGCPSN